MKKRCFSCNDMLELSAFARHPHFATGRQDSCKFCLRRVAVKDLEAAVMKEREDIAKELEAHGKARTADFIRRRPKFRFQYQPAPGARRKALLREEYL